MTVQNDSDDKKSSSDDAAQQDSKCDCDPSTGYRCAACYNRQQARASGQRDPDEPSDPCR